MKKLNWIVLILVFITLNACQDKVLETYTANVPVYMSYDEFRKDVKVQAATSLDKPSKIYVKDDYLYVNDYLTGVHIFDISDAYNPQNLSFIPVLGNIDIAIQNERLFVDNYIDLLEIDVSDKSKPQFTARKQNTFEYALPPVDNNYPIDEINPDKGVVVGWEKKEVTHERNNRNYPMFADYAVAPNSAYTNGGSSNSSGTGGSMARFAVANNTLYMLNNSILKIADISNNTYSIANSTYLQWNAETIFPLGAKLYFGTQSGLLIYDISSPLAPMYISQYDHITSCDPVVVDDTLAFATLRTGTPCNSDINRLDVVNLSKIEQPSLVLSVNFTNPHGLAVSDSLLFVCDGEAGLKVYNKKDVNKLVTNLMATFTDIKAYDVIAYKKTLILSAEDGIYLYDFSNPLDIQLKSKL